MLATQREHGVLSKIPQSENAKYVKTKIAGDVCTGGGGREMPFRILARL